MYLYYYLKSIQNVIYELKSGATQPHIYSKDLLEIKIPIPPIEVQNKIVEFIDLLYNMNEANQNKIKNLISLNDLYLNNSIKLNRNIEIKTLGEIVKYKSGKRLPHGHKLYNDKTEYPYIRITDIDNNSISLDNIKYISTETKKIINKYIITIHDIYITIAGTTGLVGIIPYQLNGANLTENAISISIINNNEILQKYLLYNLKYNQQEEFKKNTLGSAIPKLSIERLMTLKIPIPPIEVQNKIVEYLDNNEMIIQNLKKEIEVNKAIAKDYINQVLI
jgi:restriction endonuclease S subunit